MKKFLLLTTTLLLSAVAMAYDVEVDGIYYYLYSSDKTAYVTSGANKYKGDVVIPSKITYNSIDYDVTMVHDNAFNESNELTTVVLPNSITGLGNCAFKECTGLTSITIPEGVTTIGDNAFYNCTSLKSIVWNAKDCVNTKSSSFFHNKLLANIQSITFGSEVEVIPAYLCARMTALTSVVVPNNVKSIGASAFDNCTGLKSLTLSENLTHIGRYAFRKTLVEDESNWENGILYYDGYLIESDKDVVSGDLKIKEGTKLVASHAFFYSSDEITSITFPEGLKYINTDAFCGCKGISSITLPGSILSIEENVFGACSALSKVNFLGTIDQWVGINFHYRYANPIVNSHNLYINNELVLNAKTIEADSIKQYVFDGCNSLKSIEVGTEVEFVSPTSFLNCYNLSSVKWNAKNASYPNAYNYNESSPFYNLREQILSFTFGDEVEYIPTALCYGMTNIKEITVPKNVKKVKTEVFQNCSKLEKVTWNAQECEDFSFNNYMIKFPFYNCSAISEIIIGNNVEHIPACCFYGVSSASSVIFSASVKSVGKYGFYGCTGLSKVNYLGTIDEWVGIEFEAKDSNPVYYSGDMYVDNELLTIAKIESASRINDYVFNNCKSVKSVEVGLNVYEIAQNSFRDCENLVEVKWNSINCKDFASKNYAPFSYGTNVKTFEFGEEVKYIPAYLCWSLDSLKTLVIPENVMGIGDHAFVGSSNIEEVYAYPETVPTLKSSPFDEYDATLYVPCKALSDYSSDDVFRNFKEIKCIGPVDDIIETEATTININDGTISCDADFAIYNISGLDVTAQNGNLTPGVYVVSTANETVKVMVK